MPFNPQLILHNRLWAMLEAYAPFTDIVKAGNYKSLKATTEGNRTTDIDGTDPASLPKVIFAVSADSVTSTNEAVVFDDTPSHVNRAIPLRLVVDVRIVHKATSLLDDQTALECAIRAGLQTAGRTLGLAWVSRFAIEGTTRKNEAIKPGGATSYPTARFRIVVSGMVMRNTLIAV